MAHYAFLDDNNIVTEVIVGVNENESIEGLNPKDWYEKFRKQKCIRASYNGNIRKNYPGIGYLYNEELDAFIPPNPFNSWVFNKDTCQWGAPVPYPIDKKTYSWDEGSLSWINVKTSNKDN